MEKTGPVQKIFPIIGITTIMTRKRVFIAPPKTHNLTAKPSNVLIVRVWPPFRPPSEASVRAEADKN